MQWTAKMIASDHEFSGAPLLRKKFTVTSGHGGITAAHLMLSAQGLIEPWLNGKRVSTDLLTPGWSSYEWRTRYEVYDVANLLTEQSVVGLALGNGWFRGRLGWTGRSHVYGDELAAMAELRIEFEDGATQLVCTDETWKAGPSATLMNDLYDGQTIDARRRADWLNTEFDDADWVGVHFVDFDYNTLQAAFAPAVRPQQEVKAKSSWRSASGKTLVDFGQNLVGWIRVTIEGPAGTVVTIRHAEVIENSELETRPLRSALATDRYILSGRKDTFEPTFTFHGFRYAEVSGWPCELKLEDLTAIALGSDLRRIGRFESSSELLNQLHKNIVWGTRGNFVSIPTDCPQRDERLGWTGDIAVFAPTACYLFDSELFLRDWLRDLSLEQDHHDGVVPYVVPDVMKLVGSGGNLPSQETAALWSDSAVWVPWAIYQAYGDRSVLVEQFDSMVAHLRKVATLLSPGGVWDTGFQFGDWLDPDAPPDDPGAGKADSGVVATACAYRSATIVTKVAELLGRESDAAEFGKFAANLREAFNRHYVNAGTILSDCVTVYSLAIEFDLVSPADSAECAARLAHLVEEEGFVISTGFAGTPFVLDALTRSGYLDHAYRLLLQTECPSWLYPVTMGATTVWERWDSMRPDGTINPGEMTSFNHYALGAVADWMHRVVGGLAPLAPGYARVLIAPQPGGGLTEAATSLETPHGRVSVSWRVEDGSFTVDAELPEGVDGILRLPDGTERAIGAGQVTATADLPAVVAAGV
ncbi:alpha-L-rhamnosidase [Leifsonia sp. AG29]|uniref:alpha-L-rhamnosidase n=1 Tax=Leifsonia sp. AG29 TaxID=2598860 RepID=UPI001E59C989|nr:alpha-L-rhamnosidase [Leifsonia sp. AG29]